jgi:phage anti-repressor protein
MNRAYDIVKSTSFQNRTKSSIIKNKRGELLIDTEDISDRWKQYIQELYNGKNITEETDYIEQEDKVEIDF